MGFSGSFPIFFPLSFWLVSTLETHYPRQSDCGSVEKFPKKKSYFFLIWNVLKYTMTLFLHLISKD